MVCTNQISLRSNQTTLKPKKFIGKQTDQPIKHLAISESTVWLARKLLGLSEGKNKNPERESAYRYSGRTLEREEAVTVYIYRDRGSEW